MKMRQSKSDNERIRKRKTGFFLVDRSAVVRGIFRDVLSSMNDAELAGEQENCVNLGKKLVDVQTDIVILSTSTDDYRLIETIRQINKNFPTISVVIMSNTGKNEAYNSIVGLETGAIDLLARPSGKNPGEIRRELEWSLRRISRLHYSRTNIYQILSGKSSDTIPKGSPQRTGLSRDNSKVHSGGFSNGMHRKYDIVAIGTSTGGPAALGEILPLLPEDYDIPIVIIQHIPKGFTSSLAAQLDRKSRIKVREANQGEILKSGMAVVAPGGKHLVVSGRRDDLKTFIEDGPAVRGAKPSFDVLLRSLSLIRDIRTVTVTLTGMGDDGADGICALTPCNTINLVQSFETCVVAGMPSAVAARVTGFESVPLSEISEYLETLARGGRFELHESGEKENPANDY